MLHIYTCHVDTRHNKRHNESVDCREGERQRSSESLEETTARRRRPAFVWGGGGLSMLRNFLRRWGNLTILRVCDFFGDDGENVTPFKMVKG